MRLQHVPNCTFQKCAGPVCFLLKKQTWDWHSIWSLVNKAGIQSFIQLLIICIICLFPVVGAPYETLSTSTLLIQATIRKEYYIVTLIPVALLAQAMAVLVQHGHCVVLIQLYSVSWMWRAPEWHQIALVPQTTCKKALILVGHMVGPVKLL